MKIQQSMSYRDISQDKLVRGSYVKNNYIKRFDMELQKF